MMYLANLKKVSQAINFYIPKIFFSHLNFLNHYLYISFYLYFKLVVLVKSIIVAIFITESFSIMVDFGHNYHHIFNSYDQNITNYLFKLY